MKNAIFNALVSATLLTVATQSYAAPIYLNKDNIEVKVGDGTSAGTFNNTFNGGQTIQKVIDAPTSDAEEFHTQTTHIWFTADEIGGGLSLEFDFKQAYDITTLHFWNYTAENFDVDNIDFTFYGTNKQKQGELSIMPALGTSPGITAQNIVLDAPLNVQYVIAFLTGSNGQVDFQNIGFTADISQPSAVPIPAAFWLLAPTLMGFLGLRRKNSIVTPS